MYSPFDFVRFNRSCVDAMLGYSQAMVAASGEVTNHFVSSWTEAVAPSRNGDSRRSASKGRGYSSNASGSMGFGSPVHAFGMMPGINPWAMTQAWLDMDWMRAPASWPMAYGMMAAGVPRGVAIPTADANLAAMEAYQVACDGLRKVFPGFEPMGAPAPVRNFFEDARLRRSGSGRKARLARARRLEGSSGPTGFEPFFPFANFKF